jgi:hypothetical protein
VTGSVAHPPADHVAGPPVELEVLHIRPGHDPQGPIECSRYVVLPPPGFVTGDPNLLAGVASGLLPATTLQPAAVSPWSDDAGTYDGVWVHSTSWRVEGRAVVLTFLAFGAEEAETAGWTVLEPIDPARPTDRSSGLTYASVLHHAVRHLAFLAARNPALRELIVEIGLGRALLAEPSLAGLLPER